MPLSKMLLPVGFEPRDELVLAFACGLLEQGVQQLIVAHVVEASGKEAPVVLADAERARERLRHMVEPYLDRGLHIEVRVAVGSVFTEIVAIAAQVNVNVVLCGTEGKSFVDYLFSGSVSEDIALRGDVRTMTVRYGLLEAADDACQLGRDFARRLVVPTDFSSSSLRALLSVFSRPQSALGTLHVVHVLGEGESRVDADAQMRAVAAIAEEHGADYVTDLREGSPDEAVLAYLDEVGATGCITGRRGRTHLERGLLGSVSLKLLQEAPCPVVIQP